MNPIYLTIDSRMIFHSGIGVYLQELIKRIVNDSRFDITFLGDIDQIGSVLPAQRNKLKIISCSSHIYSIKEQMLLSYLVPDCDLFFSPHYNIPLLPIRAKKRLVTIHDVYHLAYRQELNVAQKIYSRIVLSLAVRLSDKVITVSNFSCNEIIRYTKSRKDKIEVIYNGVDYKKFKSAEKKTESVKRIIHGNYILFVGNVKPHKNIKRLVESFEIVLKEFPELKLVIVGKKENFITGVEGLKELLDNKNLNQKVIFTGYIEDEDLPSVYKNSELLVFPSLYEGFGLPPLEAMASGVPVVASSAASIPEVCGNAALYVNPYSIFDIADGILGILKNESLKNQMTLKGYERAELFDWETSVQKHIKIMNNLCGSLM
jgi:glycosyltransferase involved in cell wall biosynthesis